MSIVLQRHAIVLSAAALLMLAPASLAQEAAPPVPQEAEHLRALAIAEQAIAEKETAHEGRAEQLSPYFSEGRSVASGTALLQEALGQRLGQRLGQAERGGVSYPKGLFLRGLAWPRGAVLKVCFGNGTNDQRRLIASIANEWNFPGSPVRLDFGNMDSPPGCNGTHHISVVVHGTMSSSPIGRASLSVAMILGLEGEEGRDPVKVRQIVLHEFGHALGLAHELKHADGACWEEFKPGALTAFYKARYGIEDEKLIREQIATYDPSALRDFFVTSFNRQSVMMYSFPAELYRNGENSRCWAPVNHQILDGDRQILKEAYLNPLLTASQVAGLSADAGDEVRTMANAYNALILSSEEERNVLERAASASGVDATPLEIANAILSQSEALSIAAHGAQ